MPVILAIKTDLVVSRMR